MTTKTEYVAILRAGINAANHQGDTTALSAFAEACYNDNSVSELLESHKARAADRETCLTWGISPSEFRAGIVDALEARAFDFEDSYNFESAK